MINIGITCQLSRSIWSGSIKQAAINLYECLEHAGTTPIYLSDNSNISDFKKNHRAFNIRDILLEDFPRLDILIMHNFFLNPEETQKIKEKHKNCKIILYHHDNRIAKDQQSLLSGKNFIPRSENLDEIWVPEHHSYSIQYLKCYHATDATVRSVPFLWSDFYINTAKKSKKIEFDPKKKPRVLVMEPNINSSKTCLIPLLICESFNRTFGKTCESYSIFNTDKIKINRGAKELISKFSSSEQQKIFLNKTWKSVDAIDKLGQFILTHQSENELNYLYLEALSLNLPLIHNSNLIKEYGYFYNTYDLNKGVNQLYNAILNHSDNLVDYEKENKDLLYKFNPKNPTNSSFFSKIVSHLLKK